MEDKLGDLEGKKGFQVEKNGKETEKILFESTVNETT